MCYCAYVSSTFLLLFVYQLFLYRCDHCSARRVTTILYACSCSSEVLVPMSPDVLARDNARVCDRITQIGRLLVHAIDGLEVARLVGSAVADHDL